MSRITLAVILVSCAIASAQGRLRISDAGASSNPDLIELRGLCAGRFDPKIWQENHLHLLPDTRSPFIAPQAGSFRNIYAPSVVKTPSGWTIFYGGWDGVRSGNDRIYRADADAHFLNLTNRHTVIEHNTFAHVCNVNVTRDEKGGWAMMCTAYPDAEGLNKPIVFFSAEGERWNGSGPPHAARIDEIISMSGYEKFKAADINGMNVLLRDGGKWRMYFGNFRDFGHTFRASSDDGRHFVFDGSCLEGSYAINDVKKIVVAGESWYLAGLHANGSRLYSTLGRNPMKFPSPQILMATDGDRAYMVAIGFVVDGDRVLGFLYGAGAAASLDQNRIFACWLQKRVIIHSGNTVSEPAAAVGPDRQLLPAERGRGRLELLSEDGATTLGAAEVDLKAGRAYNIQLIP